MTTTVRFNRRSGDHKPGEVATVDDGQARRLIRLGIAQPAGEDDPAGVVDELGGGWFAITVGGKQKKYRSRAKALEALAKAKP